MNIVTLPSHDAIAPKDPVTDGSGQFSFTAMEGFSNFRLVATKADNGWMSSEARDFTLGKGPQYITLVLVPRAVLKRPR